jgi:uncharacterized protein
MMRTFEIRLLSSVQRIVAAESDLVGTANEHFPDGQLVAESNGEIRYGRRDPAGRIIGFETRSDTAQALDLLPHPEGGWYRRTYESAISVAPPGYSGARPSATAIYFLLGPGESSRWHRVRSDELYLWHRGELTVRLDSAEYRLGPDRPQLLIPGGTWQRAAAGKTEALISCVVSPGFDFADFEVRD